MHVLFEEAVIPKCVVVFGRHVAVCAVKAHWRAVALEGRVEALAVFGAVFSLCVPRDAADPTSFILCRALTF